MKIVAKTNDGVLIEASENEVAEILRSVNGKAPDELSIGQKIPAIDYAGSITKLKDLHKSWEFRKLSDSVDSFVESFTNLRGVVDNAANINS